MATTNPIHWHSRALLRRAAEAMRRILIDNATPQGAAKARREREARRPRRPRQSRANRSERDDLLGAAMRRLTKLAAEKP
jgi:hypothetical protein